uniref:Uncharacterized protein n=1 Tax=Rhipicephalus zambeziensis TaxID=60191 RepID=A0A224YM12_9ACAR
MATTRIVITRDRILGKCLFCSLHSYRAALIYEHELEVKNGFYSVFIVPINAYFWRSCLNVYKCLQKPILKIGTYMNTLYAQISFSSAV